MATDMEGFRSIIFDGALLTTYKVDYDDDTGFYQERLLSRTNQGHHEHYLLRVCTLLLRQSQELHACPDTVNVWYDQHCNSPCDSISSSPDP